MEKLSIRSLEILRSIHVNKGKFEKLGYGREGRALIRRGLIVENKKFYKATAAGRKYLYSLPF